MKKKVLASILALVTLFSCSACSLVGGTDGGNTSSSQAGIGELSAPTGLQFDKDTSTLSWGLVDGATEYVVYYNGNETTVSAASVVDNTNESKARYSVLITDTHNRFKVKAVGVSGWDTVSSAWSSEYTYTVEQQQISIYEKVNLALSQVAASRGYELVKVIGIDWVTRNVLEFVVFLKDSNQKVKGWVISSYNETGGTVEYLLENIDQAEVYLGSTNDTVDYNSAQYLVESVVYDGEMQALYEQGYEISVIESCTRKGTMYSKFRFEIVGTYKAVKDTDVKYFTSVNRIDVTNPQSDMFNYCYCLGLDNKCTVTETSFVLHEAGGTWLYMEDWAKAYDVAE